MTRTSLIFALFLASTVTFAQEAYRCKVNGAMVIQDSPCKVVAPSGKPQATTINPAGQPELAKPTIAAPLSREKAYLAERAREKKRNEVADLEQEIVKLRTAMNTDLDRLKTSKSYARNNLAGAVWEQSLSEEMKAVTEKYQIEIKTRQDRMTRLGDELK